MTLSSGPMALWFNIPKKYHYLLYSNYQWTVNDIINTLIENVIQVEVQLTFSGSRKSKQCRSVSTIAYPVFSTQGMGLGTHKREKKKEESLFKSGKAIVSMSSGLYKEY